MHYLPVHIGGYGRPLAGAMLTVSLLKLSGDLIRRHALDVPTLQRVDKHAVLEQGDGRRRWRNLRHALARALGRLHIDPSKNRGQVIRDDSGLQRLGDPGSGASGRTAADGVYDNKRGSRLAKVISLVPCDSGTIDEHRAFGRNYSRAVREFAAAYGIEKSAVSEHFVRTSREKLHALMERPLGKLKLCAIYIDGIEFKGQHLVVALGVAIDGSKTVLGLRQGASENATVVGELLEDIVGRGVDFSIPMLYARSLS